MLIANVAFTAGAKAEPGTPGVPQEPTTVYVEDVQNRPGPDPIVRLDAYTGVTGQTYTAHPNWLTLCNGWIASANQSTTAADQVADCASQLNWNQTQRLAWGLGLHTGQSQAAAQDNYSVSAYTAAPGPGAGLVEFQTATNILFPTSNRFVSFSVDVAATSCGVSAPLLQFSLLNDAGTATPAGSQINACSSGTTQNVPALGNAPASPVTTGTYASNGAVLISGSSVGVQMVNNNGGSGGNDHAFDNITILDATPQLDKEFSPTNLFVGGTSTLTLTITNTSELGAKSGWSFTDSLPVGLTVVEPAASTTCPAGVVTAPVDGSTIDVSGNLSAGMSSCTVTVTVTSDTAGTYTNDASNITSSVGINPPGETSVTFDTQPPFASCDATMYLAQNEPTGLFRFDTSSNPFIVDPVGPTSEISYNGIAMNPADNFIYGIAFRTTPHTLVRVGSDGSVQDLGPINGFPNTSVTGEFGPDGTFYSATGGRLYTVDVTTRTATSVALNGDFGPDLAWHNGLLYTVTAAGSLNTINPTSGAVTPIGPTGVVPSSFGGMFGASNGVFGSNNTGGFYRFNLATGRGTLISDLQGSGSNDGAKCVTTPMTFPADVAIAKDDGRETYTAGEDVVYTIVVSNDGPFGVGGTLVNDPLPDGITTASWTCGSPTGGGVCTVASGTGAIVDVPVNLPADSSVTFTLTMSVPADFEGDLVNTATVTNPPDVPDPNPSNDEDTDTDVLATVAKSKQLVGESITADGIAEPGETLTYEITLTNTNDAARGGYSLIDDYDANVTVVDADGGTDDGDLITWTGLTVPAQTGTTPGTLVLTVEVEVADPLPFGVTTISNVVYEPGETVDCAVSPTPPQCVVVPAAWQIAPLKELVDEDGTADGVAEPGETLTYNITLTNRGGATNTFAIQDVLDANTTFVSADNGGAHSGGSPGGVVDWTGLTVPAQTGTIPGTLVLTVVVTVVDPLPEGTTEVANIAKRPGDPDPECPSDQCVVVPFQETGLELVKTGTYQDTDGNGFASVGDTVRYEFTVTNTGNVPLADVAPVDVGPTFNGEPAGSNLSTFSPESVTLQPEQEQVFTATYTLSQTDIDKGAGVEDGVENSATALGYANGSSVTGTPVESEGSETTLALPAATSNISIAKIAGLRAIRRGDQAPFVIRLINNAGSRVSGLIVVDSLPSGFRYVDGSATVGGVAVTPEIRGRAVTFENVTLEGNSEIEIRLRMLALSSAGPGEHVNRASVTDAAGRQLAPEATATVEILIEPVFDCGDIIGKVFDDVDLNGYQDDGEPGLPGVRVATAKGWLITTDKHGRFHVPCAALPDQRIGSNFIMKLDTRTLPSGYRLTTENPRVVRLTAGKMSKLNFGASIGRVVRLDLKDEAFIAGGSELEERWADGIDRLILLLRQEQSVLRLSYIDAGAEEELVADRLKQLSKLIQERWREKRGQYRLEIETRVEVGE